MITALIFVISIVALVQFFSFYAQSLIASSLKHEIGESVREIAGLGGEAVEARQFGRLLQLIDLCAGSRHDELELLAVRTYFKGLSLMLRIVPQLPTAFVAKVAAWLRREREHCAHFAAIALDQRMAHSHTL